MKTIEILIINKGESGGSMSQSLFIGEKTTVVSLKEAWDELCDKANAAYGRWYYEIDTENNDEEFTEDELKMIKDAEIELD